MQKVELEEQLAENSIEGDSCDDEHYGLSKKEIEEEMKKITKGKHPPMF